MRLSMLNMYIYLSFLGRCLAMACEVTRHLRVMFGPQLFGDGLEALWKEQCGSPKEMGE